MEYKSFPPFIHPFIKNYREGQTHYRFTFSKKTTSITKQEIIALSEESIDVYVDCEMRTVSIDEGFHLEYDYLGTNLRPHGQWKVSLTRMYFLLFLLYGYHVSEKDLFSVGLPETDNDASENKDEKSTTAICVEKPTEKQTLDTVLTEKPSAKEKYTKRITILSRSYYKPGRRSGGNWTTEVQAYKNLTDKKLNGILKELNKGLRSRLWEAIHQFNLTKKCEQKAYLQYCLECYYDPNTYDYQSADVGHQMVQALPPEYGFFKGADNEN